MLAKLQPKFSVRIHVLYFGVPARLDLPKTALQNCFWFQCVADAQEDLVRSLLGGSLQEAQNLQLTCHRYLDDRHKALEAMELLKLVAQGQSEAAGGDTKRLRTT